MGGDHRRRAPAWIAARRGRERRGARRPQRAVRDVVHGGAAALDHAVARHQGARIDAENAQTETPRSRTARRGARRAQSSRPAARGHTARSDDDGGVVAAGERGPRGSRSTSKRIDQHVIDAQQARRAAGTVPRWAPGARPVPRRRDHARRRRAPRRGGGTPARRGVALRSPTQRPAGTRSALARYAVEAIHLPAPVAPARRGTPMYGVRRGARSRSRRGAASPGQSVGDTGAPRARPDAGARAAPPSPGRRSAMPRPEPSGVGLELAVREQRRRAPRPGAGRAPAPRPRRRRASRTSAAKAPASARP